MLLVISHHGIDADKTMSVVGNNACGCLILQGTSTTAAAAHELAGVPHSVFAYISFSWGVRRTTDMHVVVRSTKPPADVKLERLTQGPCVPTPITH